ncbi:MAG: type II toxin-antitoxin system RelE/ParE family toxin [Verrucomicrobia bacterium]|nr:type II toxin-antitoxin system RelE/ParE family toxin [Verrucomicrobiota bacterium]
MSIIWSSEARRSLRSIQKFIAQDSEFYATRMVARIVERVERVSMSPGQGHPVHEYPEEPLKEVHESPYRIIYGFSEETFRVVTIVHFKEQLTKERLTRGH